MYVLLFNFFLIFLYSKLRYNVQLYTADQFIRFYTGDGACFLRGTDWIFKSVTFVFKIRCAQNSVTYGRASEQNVKEKSKTIVVSFSLSCIYVAG